MDTPEKPKRSWWRRKRWAAAAVAVLVAGYFSVSGPVHYGFARRWLPAWVTRPFSPARAAFGDLPVGRTWERYTRAFFLLGVSHRSSVGPQSFREAWEEAAIAGEATAAPPARRR